ncbi:MAG TPA: hypothetical protein ENJ08_14740 [Gammaproteobacteria bacterium]|nr:hypothetical protein [Gammaproteobacteria bacterium]
MIEVYKGIVSDYKTHYESHGNGEPATLHTRLWLNLTDGKDKDFHIINAEIPVKNGHEISLFYYGEALAGYINYNSLQHEVLHTTHSLPMILMVIGAVVALATLNPVVIMAAIVVVIACVYLFREKVRAHKKIENVIESHLNN